MKDKLVSTIIDAIKGDNERFSTLELSASTKLSDIPDMDSMSVVNLQLNLVHAVGEKAGKIAISTDMSIGDLADAMLSEK